MTETGEDAGIGSGIEPTSQQAPFVSDGREWTAVMVMSGFVSQDGVSGHWIMAVERGVAAPAALHLVFRTADQA